MIVNPLSSELKRYLKELTAEGPPGPSPSFTVFHLLLALEQIAVKPIGRNKLAEQLDLGEGATRTLIKRLTKAQLITTSTAGCSLTQKGSRLLREDESIFRKTEIGRSEFAFGDHSSAVLIRNMAHKVKSGMEQRDAAVTAGAKGATTLLFRKGCLIFPSSSMDATKNFPNGSKQIIKLLKPEENDVVIIASSDDSKKAQYSALAAAWTLLANTYKD
jgi:predicted transcriptional regulator